MVCSRVPSACRVCHGLHESWCAGLVGQHLTDWTSILWASAISRQDAAGCVLLVKVTFALPLPRNGAYTPDLGRREARLELN